MIKGLEALQNLKECLWLEGALDIINQQQITIIEQELKALEIIKEKNVNLLNLKSMWLKNVIDETILYLYNYTHCIEENLTQEEYDLLKEVML